MTDRNTTPPQVTCPLFCVCDNCAVATSEEHKAADRRCNRAWVCACAACRRARELQAKALDEHFAKIEELETRYARVKALKDGL